MFVDHKKRVFYLFTFERQIFYALFEPLLGLRENNVFYKFFEPLLGQGCAGPRPGLCWAKLKSCGLGGLGAGGWAMT